MNATPVSCLATLSEDRREDFWASLALRYTAGIGFRTAKRLLVEFGSANAAMKDIKNWSSRASISAKVIEAVLSNRWREQARKEWDTAGQVACEILLWSDPEYPELLREIPDPPLFLYYKGDASLLKNPSIGVVGSRRCSNDGIRTTEMLCKTLSVSGVTTVSGLARGIDSVAHAHALSGWGSTVAVLGTGISHVYPPENKDLFFEVAERGVIVTEFPPNMPPEGRNFPLRNRIISGLSLGVLVVEALPKSGSLITARHALEQGREVFAVPGRMQSRVSSGCHELIRQGATAVFSCDDILVSIAPLLGISLDNFTRTGDMACVSSSDQPSAVAPLPDSSEFGEDSVSKELEDSAQKPESELRDTLNSSEPDEEPNVEDSCRQELSIEEQLRSIPEVIEIPLSRSEEVVETVFDDSCTEDENAAEDAADSVGKIFHASDSAGHTSVAGSDKEIELPKAKLQVHTDILPLEEKVIDPAALLEDQIIFLLTGEESVHIDVLSRMLAVPTAQVSTALLMLEVAGLVQQLPGMKYKKV